MSIIVNRNIVFLDSNQFYKGKLDNHASNLEDKDFKYLLSEFSIDQLELLKGKDAYPYEWVDSYEKFNYQELPPKECFYSSINDGKRDNSNLFIEKDMRGGISYTSKRYSKANNENCSNYDKEKPEIHINYIDINNLYGGATSEYLPYRKFKWVKLLMKQLIEY